MRGDDCDRRPGALRPTLEPFARSLTLRRGNGPKLPVAAIAARSKQLGQRTPDGGSMQSPTTIFAHYEKKISAVPLWLIPILGLLILHCGQILVLLTFQPAFITDNDTLTR